MLNSVNWIELRIAQKCESNSNLNCVKMRIELKCFAKVTGLQSLKLDAQLLRDVTSLIKLRGVWLLDIHFNLNALIN